jgi:uracil phosphoribosyltransferase
MSKQQEFNISENLIVSDHPLAQHNLTILRDKNTTPELFRVATKRLANLLSTEALRVLPLKSVKVSTPLEETESMILNPDYEIIIAPILRAALTLSTIMEELLPTARVHHIGLYRNEETLQPVSYYNKVPKNLTNPENKYVFVLDPMFATGGSAIAAVQIFKDLGVLEKNITFVSLISAPEGIKKFRTSHKEVTIITGSVDRQLNEKGYIMPGLGDAGDRTYNTIYNN